MRLRIEVLREAGEDWHYVRETRHETEIGWDADAGDYVSALAAFMFARTFAPDTIVDAFRDYVEDRGAGDVEDDEWDEYEESGDAEAGEKTVPDEDD